MGRNGASKATVVALAVLVALLASGCVMGRRSWSYEESARIDEVTGVGYEPLEEAVARGAIVPAVPVNPASLISTSSSEESAKPPKKTKLGKADGKGRSGRKSSGSSKSKGFRFSGLN